MLLQGDSYPAKEFKEKRDARAAAEAAEKVAADNTAAGLSWTHV
jgi:hypothetical protein